MIAAYEFSYYETPKRGGHSRCTTVTLHDNWDDYLYELEYMDNLMEREVKRKYIRHEPLYYGNQALMDAVKDIIPFVDLIMRCDDKEETKLADLRLNFEWVLAKLKEYDES